MGKKLIFLADPHLQPKYRQRVETLFDFLNGQRAGADAIYILGDLFDYWVGAKHCRRPAWARLLERLGEIAEGGPAIRILGGNRDFLLDAASLEPYGLESLEPEHRFEHDGLRFCLVHGDKRFPESRLSRFFVGRVQGRTMRWLSRVVPLWVSLAVAGTLRGWRRLTAGKRNSKNTKRYDPAAFLPLFEAGADVVVCGHNHWAKDYTDQLGRPGCRLFAVGSWHHGPSYLEYADGCFRLIDPRL